MPMFRSLITRSMRWPPMTTWSPSGTTANARNAGTIAITGASLHVRDHSPLEPDHEERRHQKDHEDDDHLGGRDDDLRPDEVDDVARDVLDPVDHGLVTSTRESIPDMSV